MHSTAMDNGRRFFEAYVSRLPAVKVVEIGSQDVNGSLRAVCPENASYIGVDFAAAKGVDIVLSDPYVLPFEDESIDIVVSSSCYEHSEFFWLSFLEVLRVLKRDGLFYLNVPSTGSFHRYPVDCWRFYPDSGQALVNWAKRQGFNPVMLESYISDQDKTSEWNDCVSVFLKNQEFVSKHPFRITSSFNEFTNGTVLGQEGVLNLSELTQDGKKLMVISQILSGQIKVK